VTLRRFLSLQALLFWQGGFFFYAAVVVPVGTGVLGSRAVQGSVTQQVTVWLNRIGILALAVLAWDVASTPTRRTSRWVAWGSMTVLLAALFYLHAILDANFDSVRKISPDPGAFRAVHITYLWVSSLQWLLGLAFAWLTVKAWASPSLERIPG
jgi:hypothetical protein